MNCSFKEYKAITIVNVFQKILDNSTRKPNKIWVDKGSEFYNNSFKKWLNDNKKELYSTRNEGKFAAAEGFIRTLRNNVHKHITGVSKNVYIDWLDDIVNEYSNTNHRTIKMKPVKDNAYIDSSKDVYDKDPRFKAGDHVRNSKHKNIFAKGYTPNWSEVFVNKKG